MNNLVINEVNVNNIPGKRVIGIKRNSHAFLCTQAGLVNPLTDPNFVESVKGLSNSIDGLGQVFHYFAHPMDFLKMLAQICIDLSFSTAAIVSIVALCMFVFTGCKDKKPLQYVGLSVAGMYIVSVIFSAFIHMV